MSFHGEFRHSIDAKGRLIVPSRMRDEFTAEQVVLVKWPDGCVAMFSVERWEEVAANVVAAGNSEAEARKLRRRLGSSTSVEQVDKQGRINVPPGLREHAGIERECVIVGSIDHGEIWEPARWDQEQSEGELEDLASKLSF